MLNRNFTIEELQLKFIESIPLLEQKAVKEHWCVINNHCLLRILYDFIYKDNWRNHCNKKPVYKHLTKEQLIQGLNLIEKLHTCNKEYVALLNYASLKWRNKI